MKTVFAALLSGVLFGLGLAWSGMTNPARVLGFLDVAGAWDPTLVLVMIAALAVATPAFRLSLRRPGPLLGGSFHLPSPARIDGRLLAGASVFGIGWGLAGLCPGPALAGLVTGSPAILLFVVAMIGGQWLAARLLTGT
jgi:hypothetical protein